MRLPKKIKFWLFKLKARNLNQKIKELSLVSIFWLSIITALVIWVVFEKKNENLSNITFPESIHSIDSVTVQEASSSVQVFLYTDENSVKDLPKQIDTKKDLDSLIKASQNSDINIDSDLNQIDY